MDYIVNTCGNKPQLPKSQMLTLNLVIRFCVQCIYITQKLAAVGVRPSFRSQNGIQLHRDGYLVPLWGPQGNLYPAYISLDECATHWPCVIFASTVQCSCSILQQWGSVAFHLVIWFHFRLSFPSVQACLLTVELVQTAVNSTYNDSIVFFLCF